MRKILISSWVIFCVILLVAFTISCLSAFISSLTFSYIAFFGLAFPYLFLLTLIVALLNFYIKKKLAYVMLIFLPPGFFNLSHVFAFNIPTKFTDTKNDSTTFRIMTWNVEDFVDLSEKSDVRSNMLHLVTQKNPDILCVQECTNVEGGKWRISVRREMDSIGYPYHFFSNDQVTTNANDAVVTRGVAIFSKQPFLDSGRVLIRNDAANEHLIYTNVIFNNKPVRIYTAHLASFEFYRDTDNTRKDVYQITYDRKRTIQSQLRGVEQLHQKEAEIIRDTLANVLTPVIYCGDMNAVASTFTYRIIKGTLQDAFLEAGLGFGATFYKILPWLRIDYCLPDQRFKVVNSTVIQQKLSDHYPVVTDLQWK